MTRDEAIYRLAVIKGGKEFCQGFGTKYNKDIEALDMAISALEREEKWLTDLYNNEPSDLISHEEAWKQIESDLISRADALEWLEHCAKSDCDDCAYGIQSMEWCSEKMLECVEAIKAECVSAERVGEWEHWGSPFSEDDIINIMVCTNCGMRFVEIKGEIFHYCPNCGAKMKGGE